MNRITTKEDYLLITEYFARIIEPDPVFIFGQLVRLVGMLAEETERYGHVPKSCIYANYIAGLITSIDDETDRQRAINFIEDPYLPFDKWKDEF